MTASGNRAGERTVHVLIEGQVQGVGFRAWTERTALALGLNGWVRNRRNGSVEAVFAGDPAAVSDMVSRCHKGPRSAVVRSVIIAEQTDKAVSEFAVLPTA